MKSRAYTRRKIPRGFTIGLPRQACPECGTLIDVRIMEGGQIRFIHAGKKRGNLYDKDRDR